MSFIKVYLNSVSFDYSKEPHDCSARSKELKRWTKYPEYLLWMWSSSLLKHKIVWLGDENTKKNYLLKWKISVRMSSEACSNSWLSSSSRPLLIVWGGFGCFSWLLSMFWVFSVFIESQQYRDDGKRGQRDETKVPVFAPQMGGESSLIGCSVHVHRLHLFFIHTVSGRRQNSREVVCSLWCVQVQLSPVNMQPHVLQPLYLKPANSRLTWRRAV